MKCVLFLVVLILALNISCEEIINKGFHHTNIILIGATGDLAQKYLWRSLFDLFSAHYSLGKHHFSIYGCSRKNPDAGRQFISDMLLKVILCPKDDTDCKASKRKFVEAIQFHQLKTEKHYEELASKVNENIQSMYGLQGSALSPEDGRLVYLSIPPSAYTKTSMMVNRHLRPAVGRPWFRVVIEKPFGHDFASAQTLVDRLGGYFKDKELYRVDHYLGKTVVREILPFRYLNKELYEPLWNRHHIERVEVVMKERLDVQGRVSFYDDVGVIRDVIQNHLTELATLVGMDLPENSGIIRDILNSKTAFIQQVEQLSDSSVLIGQYDTYAEECKKELSHSPDGSITPTYAAAVFSVNNPRWRNVPFLLVSGKKLDEKMSYIRILFKENSFDLKHTKSKGSSPTQIVFHISSGNMFNPDMITISNNLPKPMFRREWELHEEKSERFFFGESINMTYQLVPKDGHNQEAYTVLLNAAYMGERHMFVDSRTLLNSWKIWDNILKRTHNMRPRIYQGGIADLHRLSFDVLGTRALEYRVKEEIIVIDELDGMPDMQQIPGTFRNSRLVSGKTDDIIEKLANEIASAASDAIEERGLFHFAVPGGQSPRKLFEYLTTWMPEFPWQQTHIWQVDERCVPQDHAQSNFHLIDDCLLQYINIPYMNIHPMPVHVTCEPCMEDDHGDQQYEDSIDKYTINSTFDFTLLGVGYDGHIASLFPNQTSLDEGERLVIYTVSTPDKVSPKRMSLTFPMLNRSRNIAVLILGAKKHELLEHLTQEENMKHYPVLGLSPSDDQDITWFIDNQAYYGHL